MELIPYDSVNRLVIVGEKSKVQILKDTVTLLDSSIQTYEVNILLTTMNKGFAEDFNLIPIFKSGALTMDLNSIDINPLNNFNTGVSVLASLFNTHSEATIISKPFIQIREGVEGSFSIGSEVPIKVSTIKQDTGQIIDNIDRKRVGLQIAVTASSRPDGLIYLKLNQTLSSIAETQLSTVSDIITNDQTIVTDLLVKPDSVYVVGGLTDNRTSKLNSGIKFLPFLDSTTDTNTTQEIFIFVEVSLAKPLQER